MSLLPQQIYKKSIEVSENNEKDEPGFTKKSVMFPKQQLF
jgi:hypothetical protein